MHCNYYNIIPTYQRCLELVELGIGFSHSIQEKEGKQIHSFKYNIWSKEMLDEKIFETGGLNLRGICFVDEQIVALPFPKFFNLNENKFSTIPWRTIEDNFKQINEKIDGSLVVPIKINENYYIKSMKSIDSDVSKECQIYFDKNLDIRQHARKKIEEGFSPIYEYVSPSCRIVLNYPEPKMIYLGCRNMKTGEIILPIKGIDDLLVSIPQTFTITEAVEFVKQKGVEGIVITLDNGYMCKMKSEEYFELHKLMFNFSVKHILEKIKDNKIDDLLPSLKKYNLNDKIKQIEVLTAEWQKLCTYLTELCLYIVTKTKGLSRKEAAKVILEEHKKYANIIFKMLDKKETNTLIREYIFKKLLEDDKQC